MGRASRQLVLSTSNLLSAWAQEASDAHPGAKSNTKSSKLLTGWTIGGCLGVSQRRS